MVLSTDQGNCAMVEGLPRGKNYFRFSTGFHFSCRELLFLIVSCNFRLCCGLCWGKKYGQCWQEKNCGLSRITCWMEETGGGQTIWIIRWSSWCLLLQVKLPDLPEKSHWIRPKVNIWLQSKAVGESLDSHLILVLSGSGISFCVDPHLIWNQERRWDGNSTCESLLQQLYQHFSSGPWVKCRFSRKSSLCLIVSRSTPVHFTLIPQGQMDSLTKHNKTCGVLGIIWPCEIVG